MSSIGLLRASGVGAPLSGSCPRGLSDLGGGAGSSGLRLLSLRGVECEVGCSWDAAGLGGWVVPRNSSGSVVLALESSGSVWMYVSTS